MVVFEAELRQTFLRMLDLLVLRRAFDVALSNRLEITFESVFFTFVRIAASVSHLFLIGILVGKAVLVLLSLCILLWSDLALF